jgi:hypothetical protein
MDSLDLSVVLFNVRQAVVAFRDDGRVIDPAFQEEDELALDEAMAEVEQKAETNGWGADDHDAMVKFAIGQLLIVARKRAEQAMDQERKYDDECKRKFGDNPFSEHNPETEN